MPHIFFGLTETWLLDQTEAELHIPGYTLIRGDRKSSRRKGVRDGGGAAIYINDHDMIDHKIIMKFSSGGVEAIGVHLKLKNLVVIMVYRQPDNPKQKTRSRSPEFKNFLKELDKSLKSLPTPQPDILIGGDFNLPLADWNSGTAGNVSPDVKSMISDMHSFACQHLLLQVVDAPTHRKGNTLDLLFTNNCNYIHSYESHETVLSDHNVLEFKVHYKTSPTTPKPTETVQNDEVSFYDLNFFSDEIDWHSIKASLSDIDWSQLLLRLDPCEMMDTFQEICLNICKDKVPRKRPTKFCDNKRRIPRHRRRLMRSRRKLQKQMQSAQSESRKLSLRQKLIEIEKQLQASHRNESSAEESKAVSKIKTNSKFFYSYAQRFSKVRVGIGPLLNASGNLTADASEMSEILSEQYSSVFSKPRLSDSEISSLFKSSQESNSPSLDNISFDIDDIEEAIKELSPNSAAGPDNFPAKLLKECSGSLSVPIFLIWRKSLDQGSIPPSCKKANIIPIYKKESKSLAKNYRPVALTSLLVKVFEKIIRKNLVAYFNEHGYFNDNQHGFRSARSCLSQLLTHFDKILSLLEDGKIVDVIYLDFAKAFDKVDIGLTLKKLHKLGIKGKLGAWLRSFLTNRSQQVIVDGMKSSSKPVISGVPQGSVLGPLLFLVLIADIDQEVALSFISSFADDTRVGNGISSPEDMSDLQQDLTAVYNWASSNNMELHGDKFDHLRYLPLKSSVPPSATPYTSSDKSPIGCENHVVDLGVTMSDDGTFDKYIAEKTTKMKQKAGWILRTFSTRDPLPMLTLWKSLVLSIHDYCSQLWNPRKIGSIQSLEQVQHSFLSKINTAYDLSYWEQLSKLKLYSLQRRRERYLAIYVWKILEGFAPNISSGESAIRARWNERLGRRCAVPPIKTQAPKHVQTIRESSFSVMGPNVFNSLPRQIRDLKCDTGCDTVDKFKSHLDSYLKSVPDQPLIPGYTAYRMCESNSLINWSTSPHLNNDVSLATLQNAPMDAQAVETHFGRGR